ncbi:MAG: hypothetical protein ACLVDL_01800 [Faecalibacterium prausnitzii]
MGGSDDFRIQRIQAGADCYARRWQLPIPTGRSEQDRKGKMRQYWLPLLSGSAGLPYRDKKAIPLINKLVKILYSLHHKYWKVKNECAKFMERYADEREANQNLRQRIEMLQEENTRLKAVEHNFGRVWSYYGAEQVKRVVELMAGRERAAQNVQRQKREHENVI